jgi:pimeloyl-ACP methyl ester carboxylesterase
MFRTIGKQLATGLALAVGLPAGAPAQIDALDRVPSRFATYQNLKIHYKNLGVGRSAIVFVHGWACDLTVWSRQIEPLDGRVRLLVLDLPGHGRSDKPAGPYSMDLFAGAVNAVVETAQVDRVLLVGHSMGTPVIRKFYRIWPGKTIGLVAVDGALRAPPIDSTQLGRMVERFSGPGYRDALEQMTAPMFPAPADSALRRRVVQIARATPQHVVIGAMRAMFDPRIWSGDLIGVPLLVVVARKTGWPADYQRYLKSISSDFRYEELDEVSHFLMLERPDLFNPPFLEFVQSLGLFR